MKEIFTKIFKNNSWSCQESVSGAGSTLGWTTNLRKGLPILLKGLEVKTFLDIPCGDFNWGKQVDWEGINYVGGDIVEELIESNKQYETSNITFKQIDLSEECLPKGDIILVRDCLMHMSTEDANKCLENVFASGIKYFLSSTYPLNEVNGLGHRTSAYLHRYNLEVAPFNLGKPILYLNDSNNSLERQGISKLLGLWRVKG